MPNAFTKDSYNFEYTGYNVWLTFSGAEGVEDYPLFAVKSLTDAGFEAGDPIDITTNATRGLREQAPADLASPSEISVTVAYNLDDIALCYALLGVPCTIAVEYKACPNRPRGRKRTYTNAYLKSFTPGDMSEGAAPEATVTIGLAGGYHIDSEESTFNPAGTLSDITDAGTGA